MDNSFKADLFDAAKNNNGKHLARYLDELKGSVAAKTVLEILLTKGNEHTLLSLLELIKAGRGEKHTPYWDEDWILKQ